MIKYKGRMYQEFRSADRWDDGGAEDAWEAKQDTKEFFHLECVKDLERILSEAGIPVQQRSKTPGTRMKLPRFEFLLGAPKEAVQEALVASGHFKWETDAEAYLIDGGSWDNPEDIQIERYRYLEPYDYNCAPSIQAAGDGQSIMKL